MPSVQLLPPSCSSLYLSSSTFLSLCKTNLFLLSLISVLSHHLFCLLSLNSILSLFILPHPPFLQPRHIFSESVCYVHISLCAPACVYIQANQQKNCTSTRNAGRQTAHKHAASELSTSPALSETLRCQLYGPWLADMTGCSMTGGVCVYVCAYVCAIGLMIQQGSQLSKGKSRGREQLFNLHPLSPA